MKKLLNLTTCLWCISVAQPVSRRELKSVISQFTKSTPSEIPDKLLDDTIEELVGARLIIPCRTNKVDYYSLTVLGNAELPRPLRMLRDKTRLHLLNRSRRGKINLSRGVSGERLVGASPTSDTSSSSKARAANETRPSLAPVVFHWPRSLGQLGSIAGSSGASREPRFPLLSFLDFKHLKAAGGSASSLNTILASDLALIVGVSPQLIARIRYSSARYYRSFSIAKKGGGKRRIDSPRAFLKVLQAWLSDHVLCSLPIHPSVHSFHCDRSIVSNAQRHVGKSFVGKTDIKDFFGSITGERICDFLLKSGYTLETALLISELCSYRGALPQGAPSSPTLSNAYLYDFDRKFSDWCNSRDIEYTRYSDDITVSSEVRSDVASALEECAKRLANQYSLEIRRDKTRIVANSGQQRVTGIIVNEKALPPKVFRKMVRAAFHKSSKSSHISKDRRNELEGYVGYLQSFPSLRDNRQITAYKQVLLNAQRIGTKEKK